jgi:hypothetical protein
MACDKCYKKLITSKHTDCPTCRETMTEKYTNFIPTKGPKTGPDQVVVSLFRQPVNVILKELRKNRPNKQKMSRLMRKMEIMICNDRVFHQLSLDNLFYSLDSIFEKLHFDYDYEETEKFGTEITYLRKMILDIVKLKGPDVYIMAAQAIMEFETLWRDISKIKDLIVPCTMESFDKVCHMSHLITQFCMENIDESVEIDSDNKSSMYICRIQRIEQVLMIFQKWLKSHYWRETIQ